MKYIIFDIDGTLTNTKKVEDKCFMRAFEQSFGINIYNQKWEDIIHVTDWGITEEIILREKGRKPTKLEYKSMITTFTNLLIEEKEKDPSQFDEVRGAKSFFKRLQNSENVKLGIATGSWEKSALIKLEAIGISVNGICFSNSDYHKAREAITQDVIHQLDKSTMHSPKEIIYFGDGEWDYKTCKNLGIRFIGIDIEGDGKLSKLGAKSVFQNYDNTEIILHEIFQKPNGM